MAKDRSFASKVAKSTQDFGKHCSICGEAFNYVLVVETQKKNDKNSHGFKSSHVAVCKCNSKEVMG